MVNSERLFHTESAIAKSNESLEAAKILFDKQCYNRAVTSKHILLAINMRLLLYIGIKMSDILFKLVKFQRKRIK